MRAMELFLTAAVASRAELPNAQGVDRAVLLTIDSSVRRLSGKAHSATQAAEAALDELARLPIQRRDQERRRIGPLYTLNGTSLLYGGRLQDALAAFATALEGAGQDPLEGFHGGALAAGTHAMRGDLREAARLVGLLDDRVWPATARPSTATFLQLARVLIALEKGDLATAQAVVADLEPRIRTSEHAALIIGMQALVDACVAEPEVGLARLREAHVRRVGRSSGPLVNDFLMSAEVALHLAAGSPHRAAGVYRGSAARTPAGRIAEVRVALTLGEPRRALDLLESAAGSLTPRLHAQELALRTAASLRLVPDSSAGLDELIAALSLHGLRLPLLTLPQEDIDRLVVAAPDRLPAAVPGRLTSLIRSAEVVRLTPKEQVVLQALAVTGSAARIAERTFTSVSTVRSQQAALYRKLGVRNRQAALVRARELALLDDVVGDAVH